VDGIYVKAGLEKEKAAMLVVLAALRDGRKVILAVESGYRESPFAVVRLRTAAAKRYKKVDNATAVIWKTLLVAEPSFRRLDAPELLLEVAEGAGYVDGGRVKQANETENRKAAA